jgi:hypothetical protein
MLINNEIIWEYQAHLAPFQPASLAELDDQMFLTPIETVTKIKPSFLSFLLLLGAGGLLLFLIWPECVVLLCGFVLPALQGLAVPALALERCAFLALAVLHMLYLRPLIELGTTRLGLAFAELVFAFILLYHKTRVLTLLLARLRSHDFSRQS